MKASTVALASLSAAAALAAPVETRSAAAKINDAQILNYALTLEHLEATFYAQGLQNFSQQMFANAGFGASFYNNLKEIASDEATHVSFLTGALTGAGYNATAACTYNFPYSNPKEFVALASILEGVGVSAYLGAASYIANKGYLTAAGKHHQAFNTPPRARY